MNLIIAVTGASGSIYADILFERLQEYKTQFQKIGVIFSDHGKQVWEYELGNRNFENLPFTLYEHHDLFSAPASGSAGFDAMVICPCSMGTLGRIAAGTSDNLIIRAADVMLKERRKLILVPRETPFNLIHLRNMEFLSQAGAIIVPASPSFYSKPQTIREAATTVVDRIFGLLSIPVKSFHWGDHPL